jgi:hypothetical protein
MPTFVDPGAALPNRSKKTNNWKLAKNAKKYFIARHRLRHLRLQ